MNFEEFDKLVNDTDKEHQQAMAKHQETKKRIMHDPRSGTREMYEKFKELHLSKCVEVCEKHAGWKGDDANTPPLVYTLGICDMKNKCFGVFSDKLVLNGGDFYALNDDDKHALLEVIGEECIKIRQYIFFVAVGFAAHMGEAVNKDEAERILHQDADISKRPGAKSVYLIHMQDAIEGRYETVIARYEFDKAKVIEAKKNYALPAFNTAILHGMARQLAKKADAMPRRS